MWSRHRYRLSRQRTFCPNCGKRDFKQYVDTYRNDTPVAPECGRCNRERKCGYQLSPKEYFTNNYMVYDYRDDEKRRYMSAYSELQKLDAKPLYEPDPWFIDKWKSGWALTPVGYKMVKMFDYETASTVALMMGLGGAEDNTAAYICTDVYGRIRTAKLIEYDAYCHRVKGAGAKWAHTMHSGNRGEVRGIPFFGSDMAHKKHCATIVVVESEKTAYFLNCYFCYRKKARFVAIACGGASNLVINELDFTRVTDLHRARVLLHRNVILLPDADMVEKWQEVGKELTLFCRSVRVVDTRLPPLSLTDSQDVGDLFE